MNVSLESAMLALYNAREFEPEDWVSRRWLYDELRGVGWDGPIADIGAALDRWRVPQDKRTGRRAAAGIIAAVESGRVNPYPRGVGPELRHLEEAGPAAWDELHRLEQDTEPLRTYWANVTASLQAARARLQADYDAPVSLLG